MVFQSYSLFPHMTVEENVRFPLRMRTRLSRRQAHERVGEMLDLVQLGPLAKRYPRQLSGGQQQRVAMARALVSSPRLLLMDEPLGALDKKLREQMQTEIKRIHRTVGTTVIYVTHDQGEALTMSDLVAVMHHGRIAQTGTPRALYEAPADLFVADFLGDSNLLRGQIRAVAGDEATVELTGGTAVRAMRGAFAAGAGAPVVVLIRPEDVIIAGPSPPAGAENTLTGIVRDLAYHGDMFKLEVAIGSETLKLKLAREHAGGIMTGQQVHLAWRARAARVFAAEDEESTRPTRLRRG
jgi:putative spermidine/putrescine transport system ATP-binding protein